MSGAWLKEKSSYKPMLNSEGQVCFVHKSEVLNKLKEGWDLKLQSASLLYKEENGQLLKKRIQLRGRERDSQSQKANLIEHLEVGWYFGVVKNKL